MARHGLDQDPAIEEAAVVEASDPLKAGLRADSPPHADEVEEAAEEPVAPPVEEPPSSEPPAEEPPSEIPPAEEPPAEEPPVTEPEKEDAGS